MRRKFSVLPQLSVNPSLVFQISPCILTSESESAEAQIGSWAGICSDCESWIISAVIHLWPSASILLCSSVKRVNWPICSYQRHQITKPTAHSSGLSESGH